MDTKILRNMSYGVYIITTMDNDRPVGCTANSVMQVTSSPVTVALSMNHDNYTNECIKKSKKFAVSVMAEDSDSSLIGTFGFQSSKTVNKFENVRYDMKEDVPIIPDTLGYMVFDVISSIETTSHTVFIGQLIDADITNNGKEMTYGYYHNVIKGKSPKNAPTYVKEEDEEVKGEKEVYKCSVCGYVYDGDIPFENLPDDYTCPICKKPKSVFVKIK